MQAPEAKFEAAVYKQSLICILASVLIYHGILVRRDSPRLDPPQDLAGRRLLVSTKQREIKIHVGTSAQIIRYVMRLPCAFQLLVLIFFLELYCSGSPNACITVQPTSIFHSTSPQYGSVNAHSNAAPNWGSKRSTFPLLRHASAALLFSSRRLMR